MRILVTGVKGQLGHDVVNEMEKRGLEAVGVDVEEMDITDKAACEKVITEAHVDAVIHCAAYTAVDAAEDNVEVCRRVNADGTRNIAEVCGRLGIKMMYIRMCMAKPSMKANWRWKSWWRNSLQSGLPGYSA